MDLSLVIPAKNEEKSLPILYREILASVKPLKKSFEIIFIDDGSTDNSYQVMQLLKRRDQKIKIIKFRGNFGKAAALAAGFEKAQGKIVFTLDADLQDDPREIPNFLAKINQGYDLVSGWKKQRHDSLDMVIPSRFWNLVTATLSGVRLHDFNCGFKAYKKEVVKSLSLYGELYRLIPVLAANEKFKVTEIPIHHRARKYGRSKFGWEKFFKGFLDMITVVFLTKFMRKPAHFFGGLGFILSISGFFIGLYIAYLKISFGNIQGRTPLLLAGILLTMIGVQLICSGLLAEMLISFFLRQNPKKTG